MPHDSGYLQKTLGITQGIPYQSTLMLDGDEERQTPGIAIFKVGNGVLYFDFYINRPNNFAGYESLLQGAAKAAQGTDTLYIEVPSAELKHPVLLTTLVPNSHDERPFEGLLMEPVHTEQSTLGESGDSLEWVLVELLDIPGNWGYGNLAYHYGTLRYPIDYSEDGQHILIPTGTLGGRALSGCTISAGGWTVEIHEIPRENRRNDRVTHQCVITRTDGTMNGPSAWEFFEEELWPFLCFVFAHKVQVTHMTGPNWGRLRAVRPEPIRATRGNWFMIGKRQSSNLQMLFKKFHSQPAEIKKHWRKVIDRYAASEEIRSTFGDPETAEAVSFAGLEGLIRSIISTYDDKDQWLNSKLELEPKENWKDGGKAGITDAIEMVLRRELTTDNPGLREPLSQLTKLRNSTAHTDLQSEPNWQNAHNRWNGSQALVEMLLLRQMGLEEIPNRTMHGTFSIMGHDMYKEARKETILPRLCQNCGEWTGTLTHRECNQSLCSPCWEDHNRSGCSDASYPPTQ